MRILQILIAIGGIRRSGMASAQGRMCLLAILMVVALSLSAQERRSLVLTAGRDYYPLGINIDYLEDKGRSLTIEDISSPRFSEQFLESKTKTPSFGIKRSAFWIRLRLRNERAGENQWILEYSGSGTNSVGFYSPDRDHTIYIQKTTGSDYPFNTRDVPHRNFVFRLNLPYGQEDTFYLRVIDDGPVSIPLILWSRDAFSAKNHGELLVIGILLGVLLIMMGYNFLLAVMLRDAGYLSYATFLFALAGLYADGRGVCQQYLWPNLPISSYMAPVFIALATASLFVFTRTFLRTRSRFPMAHRIIGWMLIALGIDAVLVLFTILSIPRILLALLFLIAVITLSTLAVVAWRRGFRPALYLLIAWPAAGIGIILYLLDRLAALPSNPVTSQMAWGGTVLLVALWSLALADRITITTKEKDKAKEDLLRQQEEAIKLKDAFNVELQHKNIELERAMAERALAAEALGLSERRYADLFEFAHDAIFTLSLDGTIITANKVFGEITGWDENDWKGQPFHKFLHPDDAPQTIERFQEYLKGRFYGPIELRVLSKKGELVMVDISLTPELINGQIACFLGIARDITARRKLEEQIIQAQKMESIGLLAGGVAHDFNNILAAILGNATLIAEDTANREKLNRRVAAILAAAERGADVVKQLLTFARKTETKMVSLKIGDVLHETIKLLEETFPKKIAIRLGIEPGVPELFGDRGQLQQVLLNLCVNARDAMPGGGILSFSTGLVAGEELRKKFRAASSAVYVRVSVADSGIGMSEDLVKKIFDPFFTTKGVGEGTGLGLAVVFAIVESHRGFIDVKSAEGTGTTFLVYLPAQSAPAATAGEDSARKEKLLRGNDKVILLIEDEALVRGATTEILQNCGYRVIVAGNGAEGVAMFEKHRNEVAVVLSDLGLPRLNGVEVFRRIRSIQPDVKFVLTSGFLQPDEKAAMDKDGLKLFIQKPYLSKDLLRTIQDALNS